jgi:hypothetical protein
MVFTVNSSGNFPKAISWDSCLLFPVHPEPRAVPEIFRVPLNICKKKGQFRLQEV